MKYFFIIIVSLISLSAIAQKEIKIEDAINHVGDSVKICSTVYGGRYIETLKNSPTFLNLGSAYPNALLTIVIPGEVRKQFKNAPEDFYNKSEICVMGKIEMYKDKPQIVLSSSKQMYNNQ